MYTKIRSWGDRLFPEFQILVRRSGRVAYLHLTSVRQAAFVGMLVVSAALIAYLGARYQHFDRVVVSRDVELARADHDKAVLQQQISQLKAALSDAQERMAATAQEKAAVAQEKAEVATEKERLSATLADSQQHLSALTTDQARVLSDRKEIERKLAAAESDRKDLERKLAASEDKLNSKVTALTQLNAQLTKSLEADRDELRHADSKQATLQNRLVLLEKELEKTGQHAGLSKSEMANIASLEPKSDAASDEVDNVKVEKTSDIKTEKTSPRPNQLKAEVANIERKLQNIVTDHYQLASEQTEIVPTVAVASSNPPPAAPAKPAPVAAVAAPVPVAAAPPAPVPAASPAPVASVAPTATVAPVVAKPTANLSESKGSELERLIASTGIDVARLMKDVGSSSRGEGGPYVALSNAPRATSDSERQNILQKLMQTLPLKAPLDEYRLESPFGSRIDPINHRRAFHSGLDMSAPYRTHVYSTAPGIVLYAGSEDAYGRVVEIDHGHGIVTRYAHLHRSFVVKGQKVTSHTAIGELGSTGRSTGPHVHYEIVVDGVPQDPAKFIGVGKNVVQAGVN